MLPNIPATCKAYLWEKVNLQNLTAATLRQKLQIKTYCLMQSHNTDTSQTSPGTDHVMPDVWQGTSRAPMFKVTGMTWQGTARGNPQNPCSPARCLTTRPLMLQTTLPDAWHHTLSVRTGWPSVSLLKLSEIANLICNFYLSVAAMNLSIQIYPWDTLAHCWDVKQPTNNKFHLNFSFRHFYHTALIIFTPSAHLTLTSSAADATSFDIGTCSGCHTRSLCSRSGRRWLWRRRCLGNSSTRRGRSGRNWAWCYLSLGRGGGGGGCLWWWAWVQWDRAKTCNMKFFRTVVIIIMAIL